MNVHEWANHAFRPFADNRRNIFINYAAQMLRSLELEKALAVYGEILADNPSDSEILFLRKEVEIWRERLDRWSSTGLSMNDIAADRAAFSASLRFSDERGIVS